MVNYKVYPDNLPSTIEETEKLLEQLLKEKVLNDPTYNYQVLGFQSHSGTQYTINHKCAINFSGVLVIHILGKDYRSDNLYSPYSFNADIQRKFNRFEEYLRKKT